MQKRYFQWALACLIVLFNISPSQAGATERLLEGKAANSEIEGTELIRYKDFSAVPAFIKFKKGSEIAYDDWQRWMLNMYFKSNDNISFELLKTERDDIGMTHDRFQQVSQEYPLAYGIWIVHTINGQVVSMNGELFDEVDEFSPSLSEAEALQLALTSVGATEYMWEVKPEEMFLKQQKNDPEATYFPKGELVIVNSDPSLNQVDLKLSWKFNVYASEPMSRAEIFIDASAGTLIFKQDMIHHADSIGTAVTNYNGTFNIVADYTGTFFRLRENSRGNGVSTYDLNSSTTGLGSDFTDNDNFWNSGSASMMSGPDAHFGAEMTYDFYYDNFGRNSIDDNGFELISRVNYGVNYTNAFWNGDYMTYGSGGASFAAIDVAGHEVSHGLTSYTANLVYSYESGALNESFSDIFGCAIEFFTEGSISDWTMGEDRGSVIRSMSNPGTYGDPDTYLGTNWSTGAFDNGGVHINSGVQNFWFYLLTVGGTGVNDNSDSYSVTGIGVEDAQAIAFRNLTVYLTTSSQYADARFYAIQAATDLFGLCSQQLESTGDAWHAVGIGNPLVSTVDANFTSNITTSCELPALVQFTDFSSNTTTYSWNFGDGGTSTAQNPSHNYTQAGTYTVSLAVSSTCGTDTKTEVSYVSVGPDVPCDYTMPSSGQGETQKGCQGFLYDNGGPDGNYLPQSDCYVTIAPCGANSVTINFDVFFFEAGAGCQYDYLKIYDGPDMNSQILGTYCGSNQPPTSLTSTGPSITIQMHSDGGLEYSGFQISWQCEEGNAPPTPEFTAQQFETCNGAINFEDESELCPDSFLWRFGDGKTSNLQHPTHIYDSNGVYDVTLISTNANGSDSIVKQAYIVVNRPEGPLVQNKDICPDESVTLHVTPQSIGETRWYDSGTSAFSIQLGDSFTTPVLTQTTNYYVETVVEATTTTSVGPVDYFFGTGGYLNADQYLVFDAFTSCKLASVKVFAESAGIRTIQLRDESGYPIQSVTVNLPTGESVVDLNFDIEPGTDLQLGLAFGSEINLYRNNNGANYPYVISNVISITKSSANGNPLGYYYYFYDWQIRDPDCVSERKAIQASTAICLGVEEINADQIRIYPNPNQGTFLVDLTNVEAKSISVYNQQGQIVKQFQNLGGSQTEIDLNQAKGVYHVSIQTINSVITKRVVVQ